MRIDTPLIIWHSREPVLAVDICPTTGRIATAGADKHVRIWSPSPISETKSTVDFIAHCELHEKPVNIVRFSPNGKYLASASDDRMIYLWQRVDTTTTDAPTSTPTTTSATTTATATPTTTPATAPVTAPATATAAATDEKSTTSTSIDLTSTDTTDAAPTSTPTTTPPSTSTTLTTTPTPTTPTPTTSVTASVPFGSEYDDLLQKEVWKQCGSLRGHLADIYDLCWSPDGTHILSGSVDNQSFIWDVHGRKKIQHFEDHANFVQGVCWDPCNRYVVTQSSDRSVKVYQIGKGKGKERMKYHLLQTMKHRSTGGVTSDKDIPDESQPDTPTDVIMSDAPTSSPTTTPTTTTTPKQHTHLMYMDETIPSFFRRLTWSPDGSFLVTPTGLYKDLTSIDESVKPIPSTYIFHRSNLRCPVMVLPCTEPSVAIKFSPIIYQRRHPNDENAMTNLPYRMIFAVITTKCLYLYDTEQLQPFVCLRDIHYLCLTDISWSADGHTICISSTDGYVSMIQLDSNELGEKADDETMVAYHNMINMRRQRTKEMLEDPPKKVKVKNPTPATTTAATTVDTTTPISTDPNAITTASTTPSDIPKKKSKRKSTSTDGESIEKKSKDDTTTRGMTMEQARTHAQEYQLSGHKLTIVHLQQVCKISYMKARMIWMEFNPKKSGASNPTPATTAATTVTTSATETTPTTTTTLTIPEAPILPPITITTTTPSIKRSSRKMKSEITKSPIRPISAFFTTTPHKNEEKKSEISIVSDTTTTTVTTPVSSSAPSPIPASAPASTSSEKVTTLIPKSKKRKIVPTTGDAVTATTAATVMESKTEAIAATSTSTNSDVAMTPAPTTPATAAASTTPVIISAFSRSPSAINKPIVRSKPKRRVVPIALDAPTVTSATTTASADASASASASAAASTTTQETTGVETKDTSTTVVSAPVSPNPTADATTATAPTTPAAPSSPLSSSSQSSTSPRSSSPRATKVQSGRVKRRIIPQVINESNHTKPVAVAVETQDETKSASVITIE